MFVGVARIVVQIPGARSLKDRRAVVRSFKDRVGARLKISIAEIGDPERWQIATFGVATVSSDRSRCEELVTSAVSIARSLSDAVVADVRTETLSFGHGGENIKHGIESALDDDE
jgi:uncharacterized protein YlxP (DUF503 family)